jgi:membrane protein implicated in regulation of membrane protease activity
MNTRNRSITKKVSLVALAVALLIVIEKTSILNALLLFFLVGAIPGTSYSVPSGIMLSFIILATWVLVFHFAAIHTLQLRLVRNLEKRYADTKKRLPKRRFGQI